MGDETSEVADVADLLDNLDQHAPVFIPHMPKLDELESISQQVIAEVLATQNQPDGIQLAKRNSSFLRFLTLAIGSVGLQGLEVCFREQPPSDDLAYSQLRRYLSPGTQYAIQKFVSDISGRGLTLKSILEQEGDHRVFTAAACVVGKYIRECQHNNFFKTANTKNTSWAVMKSINDALEDLFFIIDDQKRSGRKRVRWLD